MRVAALEVPAPSQGIRSAICIIRIVEPRRCRDSIEDPFRPANPGRAEPRLAIAKGQRSYVGPVTVYPVHRARRRFLEFIRDGPWLDISRDCPAGLIGPDQILATFPTPTFGPGKYELRALSTQP